MTLTSRQVTVTTSAGIEITDGTAATINQSYALTIKNTDSTNPVYLGGSSAVTSSTGYKLTAGESVGVDMAFGEQLFARATGGSVVVGVLQSKF